MLMPQDRLSPNEQEVAAKVIDGEAILINLSSGIYYSLDGVGAFIWERIAQGYSLEEIVAGISARYDVSAKLAKADVQKLATELQQENLVAVSDSSTTVSEMREQEQQSELPYEAPTLNIYRDMGDLLALDPPMPGLADMAWKDPEDETPG